MGEAALVEAIRILAKLKADASLKAMENGSFHHAA
jgi:hypothetical protein